MCQPPVCASCTYYVPVIRMCMSVEPEHETCPHTSHTRFKSVPRAPLKKERDCKSLKGKIVQIMALNSEREQSIANRDRSFLID